MPIDIRVSDEGEQTPQDADDDGIDPGHGEAAGGHQWHDIGEDVTADLLKKLCMNVDLQTMDWGTVGQRRTSKAPVEQGGWSIFHTWTTSVSITNPALNYYLRGQEQTGWFGWYENAEAERLTDTWAASTTDAEKQAVFGAIQRESWTNVPFVPLGQYFPTTAHRSNIVGRIPATNALAWNVRRT